MVSSKKLSCPKKFQIYGSKHIKLTSSLSFLNRVNAETNGTSNNKSYLLGAMLVSTNLNYACAVPRETKCEHATPLVPLEQSAMETIADYSYTPSGPNEVVSLTPQPPPCLGGKVL